MKFTDEPRSAIHEPIGRERDASLGEAPRSRVERERVNLKPARSQVMKNKNPPKSGATCAPPFYACLSYRVTQAIAGVPYGDLAAWYAHPYLRRAVILPDGDPSGYLVHLAPSWQDIEVAVEAALDKHDGLTGDFDLAPYLPRAASLPDWKVPASIRGIWYCYQLDAIERDYLTGRLSGPPILSLLPS